MASTGATPVSLLQLPVGTTAQRPSVGSAAFTRVNTSAPAALETNEGGFYRRVSPWFTNTVTGTINDPDGKIGIGTTPVADLDVNGVLRYVNPKFLATGASGTAVFDNNNPIPFNTVVYDSASAYNTSTYQYTVPRTGRWLVYGGTYAQSTSGGSNPSHAQARVNSATEASRLFSLVWGTTGVLGSRSGSTILSLNSGDTVDLYITNSGGTTTYTLFMSDMPALNLHSFFGMLYLGES